MSWQSEMDELRRRESMAEELGGAERVKRQHDGGRMTIRERIAKLTDPGSFREVGKIAGKATYDGANELALRERFASSGVSAFARTSSVRISSDHFRTVSK